MKEKFRKINKFPVVFFIFRRPETTKKVLSEIIKSKPSKLYIFADGPRNTQDIPMVDMTRKIVDGLLKNTDINVTKRYRNVNFGLKESIIKGLDEVFAHESAAIILEDDCLPSIYFFNFCNTALSIYMNEEKINTVCGTNINVKVGSRKFILSKYFLPWGWALWKRSWSSYKEITEKQLGSIIQKKNIDSILAWYLTQVYDLSKKGGVKAWSYRMVIMQIVKNKFSLYPPVNTVSNIGFGDFSSNTLIKTKGSNLKISNDSERLPGIIPSYQYSPSYDNQIAHRLYLTPISFCGLILRKYFPAVIKYLYRK